MASEEEVNIEDEIIEESQVEDNPKKKKDKKDKKITMKLDQKKPIDGKQQFGDKSICRLCKVTTQSTPTIICIRCHFKYHKECIRTQNKEPQFQEGTKWYCLSCIERMAKRKLKESEPQKKKKTSQIPEFFQKTLQPQEDKLKKHTEFQQKYPTYVQQGRVIFPIFDEYLTAYQQLFTIEIKKKPILQLDPTIPQNLFEDILKIWDSYNYMDKIVSDILYAGEQQTEQQSQVNNIGTLIHFKDNHTPYSQKTRLEIYNIIQTKPEELILFFCYFYLKQIIEDLDQEQMQKQSYKIPYWHLLGYMWFTNRIRYYELLRDDIKQLPTNIYKQGILPLTQDMIDFSDYTDIKKVCKLLIALSDGLTGLKKTQFLYQFRTENLLSNNRIKQQLGTQIKQQRSQQIDIKKEIIEAEGNISIAKSQLKQDGLTRVESQKFTKQMEQAQKQAQKLKQQYSKLEKEIASLTERYNQQDKELAITQMPALLLNPSMCLGQDAKHSSYYFFLYEPDKIFVCMRHSIIDDDGSQQWGFYDQTDIQNLLNSLCPKGVRENTLKNNIIELQRAKLLQINEQNQEQNNDQIEQENNKNGKGVENDIEQEVHNQSEEQIERINSLINLDVDELVNEFVEIESSLTQYLNQKNSRWCSTEQRIAFLKSFQNVIEKKSSQEYDEIDLKPLGKAIEYFVDNTMMQEKLELRLDEDIDEKLLNENEDDSYQQPNRRRKVVEDDSSVDEQPQTMLQQLEQMDIGKVRVRKLPMKLFGTYYETLRLNLIEQLKFDCNLAKMKICLEVLGQIVKDYIDRKKIQIQQQIIPVGEKKKVEEVVVVVKKNVEPQPQFVQEAQLYVTQNLRKRNQKLNGRTDARNVIKEEKLFVVILVQKYFIQNVQIQRRFHKGSGTVLIAQQILRDKLKQELLLESQKTNETMIHCFYYQIMICDLVDYTLRTTPNKGRFSQTNTTTSPNSSSNSSFEASQLKIPRPLLSFDEKFEASLCAFEFKLLVPEEDGLINFEQFSQELIQDKLIFLNDEKYLQQQQASLEILEENILKDDRTTLMLKNIPRSMKPNDLRNILNKEFRNLYDFFYLPLDNNNEGHLGYAFVNFINQDVVLKFYRTFNNQKWTNTEKQICQLKYAKLQGRRQYEFAR
ncbi:unnamed protein product [Paramecium pentaurelia]|uniref:Uncharacterized protein n=1 Tax=Paramecium pentaurelia TaxID=43138 RepID=A0A8S1XZV2_9CILI|nr:unnamed protein product [Paramecium pentaurelia]